MSSPPHDALATAADHARACWPDEACGVIVREPGAALRFIAVPNHSPTPATSYFFDPAVQLAIWRAAAAGAFEIVALVHSHCGAPAEFSQRDREDAVADDGRPLHPGVEYWVLSLAGPPPDIVAAKAFTWRVDGWSEQALPAGEIDRPASCMDPGNSV